MMKVDLLGRWKWVCFWSITLYITFVPGCEADVQPCYIGSLSLPQGSWVAAYDDLASHISGCTVTYNSSTSVVAYVLSLTSAGLAKPNSEKQPVVLNIEQTPFAMLQSSSAKIVFVLSSSDPVSWDIRMKTFLTLPSFLVSRPNTVSSPANIDVSVEENLPTSRDGLLEWVGNRYSAATFAEVSYANYISVSLNQETHVNRTCVVSDDWKQNEISAKFIKEKPIQGCKLPLNSRELDPEVYAIEHKRVGQDVFKQTVTLNLRTVKHDTRLHNIMLLLKSSSSHVLWDVHGTSGIGSLKIQSNGEVSSQDHVFESVTPSPEFDNESGQDLVQYLEQQYKGVVQYLSVDTANRIEVTLEAPGVPKPPNFLFQDSSPVLPGDDLLKHIIHTRCYEQSMVIAISLKTLRKNNMRPKDIHLSDRSCNATVNETHMVFTSKLEQCGMKLKYSNKKFVYVNKVIFNPGTIEKGSSLAEDGGSGLLPDDEDASNQRRPSESEVHCSYPNLSSPLGDEFEEPQDMPVTYKVCTGLKCPPVQFSVSTIYNDPDILATVRSCTVTSMDKAVVDYPIIENGCTLFDSVILTRNVNESMRINSLPLETNVPYELTCEVAICSPLKEQKYPQCPDRKTDLPCALRDPIESIFLTTYKIHFGPKIIPIKAESANPGSNVGSNIEKVTTKAPNTTEIIGLSTVQVVGIAFAAFLMGVFFVAAIWCIHVHTAIPRGNQEQTSASQPPPYQPTSNGYAGYRQVPNGHTSNGYAGSSGHTLNGFGPTINPNGIPMNGMMNSADLAMV